MAVTAKFTVDRIDASPDVATALTLRLYNDHVTTNTVTLSATGDLHDHARLDLTSVTLETSQIVDVPVTIAVPSTIEAGTYTLTVEAQVTPVAAAPTTPDASVQHDLVTASTIIELTAHAGYTIALHPAQSRGSSSGLHAIRISNTGNVTAAVELVANSVDDAITVELGQTMLNAPPGSTHETSVRVTPARTYRNGPSRNHDFAIEATSVEGRTDRLDGTYQQRPRVPAWLGPAATGAAAALVIGAIVWLAFLRPWVEDTAEQAAADAIELDRAALRERIDELQTAAAEAEELPLGTPTDIRLDVDPAGGNTEQAVAIAEPGTTLSITDVVLQNPTGAVGTVSWRRGDEVLLQSELANFRDFDLHFVAPYQFDDDVEIVLEVDCRTPGAGESTCPIGVSMVGFVDEAD